MSADFKPADHILDEFLGQHGVRLTVAEFSGLLKELRASIAEEIAVMLEGVPARFYPEDIFLPDGTSVDAQSARVMRFAYPAAARMVRDFAEES